MMRNSWAQLVSRCTYIPDSEIEIRESEKIGQISLGSQIRLTMKVQDTYNPGNPNKILIAHVGSLPFTPYEFPDQDMALRYIHNFIRGTATHEADEWFRVDGKIYEDPHKRR
jgi:hypothetical protein